MMALSTAVLAAACFVSCAASAATLNTRTWVSGAGSDAVGCGPIASPCRTLQYAHDATSAGGEIDVKDSAGYGSLSITKAISVVGNGSLSGVLASLNGNAITVTAGASDTIILRGLTIEGAKIGRNGIVFNSGGVLDVADCVIQNFLDYSAVDSGHGILLQPASGPVTIFVTNTITSHNQGSGIFIYPQAIVFAALVFDHVTALANGRGIEVEAFKATSAPLRIKLSHSIASRSLGEGLSVSTADQTSILADNCDFDQNGTSGLGVDSGTVAISRSSISNNNYGINITTSVNNTTGTVLSFGDNRFFQNAMGNHGLIGSAALQ